MEEDSTLPFLAVTSSLTRALTCLAASFFRAFCSALDGGAASAAAPPDAASTLRGTAGCRGNL